MHFLDYAFDEFISFKYFPFSYISCVIKSFISFYGVFIIQISRRSRADCQWYPYKTNTPCNSNDTYTKNLYKIKYKKKLTQKIKIKTISC